MVVKKEKGKAKQIDNIFTFLENDDHLSNEELREELREEGVDPDKLVSKGKLLVETKLKEALKKRKTGRPKMRQLTKYENARIRLKTQYGNITYKKWCIYECARIMAHGKRAEVKPSGNRVALFVEREEEE